MFDLTKDWKELPSRNEMMKRRASRELESPPPPEVQAKWDIPELLVVTCAVSGRIALEHDAGMPVDFPVDFEGVARATAEVVEAGACGVHIDFGGLAAIQESGLSVMECHDRVISDVRKATDADWVVDCNILRGNNFYENAYPILAGYAETMPMAPNFPVEWMQSAATVAQEHGAALFFSVHSTSEVDLANRYLLSTGIVKKPSGWCILIGYPIDDATDRLGAYLPHTKAMMTELIQIVDRIHEIDADAFIYVCASGRAGHYLATAAIMLGLHVRVGTEDAIYRYPHKDEIVSGNLEMVARVKATAEVLGRRLATPAEYREMIGISKRKAMK